MQSKKLWRSFIEAKSYVHSLKLSGAREYNKYCKDRKIPNDIPATPYLVYRDEGWIDWRDFLGLNNRKFLDFEHAKRYVHALKLGGNRNWKRYCRSGKKPANIPAAPNIVYGKEWKGWGDWIGTGNIPTWLKKYRSFAEARKFVHGLRLRNNREWRQYCRSGKKPTDVPANPNRSYETEWKDWGDWFGTWFKELKTMEYIP